MQGYPQQQSYAGYAGYAATDAQQQLQQQQQQEQYAYAPPDLQQQQYSYGPTATSGDYGLHYSPVATGEPHSLIGGSTATNSGYSSNFPQQVQPQQQQLHNGYNGSVGRQQSYNYQPQATATNEGYNGGAYEETAAAATAGPAAAAAASPSPAFDASTSACPDSALSFGFEQPTEAPNTTDANGLRWTWSTYPNTYRDSKQEPVGTAAASVPLPEMIIPLACMYTPLHPIDAGRLVIGDPSARGQQCPNCGAYWNKHCYREEGKFWVCLSCLRRNPTPPSYNPQHPALHNDTVEYILPTTAPTSAEEDAVTPAYPTFIFIIDTCLPVEELDALKSHIVRCLDWLPLQSLVGLISFGARVSVWELGSAALARCFNVRGDKLYDPVELSAMLQLVDAQSVRGRFLVPLEECEFVLTTLIEEMQCNDTITPADKRPLRTTGTAVSIAVRLFEALQQTPAEKSTVEQVAKGGRLLLFTGGPCTRGPGTVVSVDKEKMMRFHRDIIDGETPYYEASFKMYNDLQQRLSNVNASLDVFAESFDQIGILEMRQAVNQTGGTFVCGDAFSHQMFATSLQGYFDRCDLRIRGLEAGSAAGESNFIVRSAFGVKFEVHTSADTLVSGVLGPCLIDEKANKAKPHRASSPIQVGVGGTTRWCVSTVDQAVTYTFVFDTATMNKKDGAYASGARGQGSVGNNNSSSSSGDAKRRFVQFVTRFSTPNGESRVRVTSVVLPVAPSSPSIDPQYFVRLQSFDQTCAATVLARMVVSILEKHPSKWDDTKRWLDTLLVRFVRRYSTYTAGVPESLRLSPCLSLFPSFMFNLRRSEYFMVLNISPDETAFKRHWLMREPVENCVLMIQPTLHSYDIEAPMATPVPLDSCSLRPDNVLLMDAYFNIHIMWGTTIYAWIQAKYHEDPEYAYFAQLLDTVEGDALALLAARYPYPRFSRTDANGSEARHIKTRMNPTTTHHSTGAAACSPTGDQSDVIYTDEASIVKFMESLKQAVVTGAARNDGATSASNGGR
ncbi:putative protein transport protein Sec23A [Trypanosoma grayi]|uniref:putative protein transport protein Sec23A n=1 Tax=Trypanosoma grayi TaxID=71804 RepID=UPI0004F40D47|nr:putative protein transport protein Sec23A [Trypanosoma grayi]KEG06512.1 putative protein transport protein Sec23A [Trypanosoma grayi]